MPIADVPHSRITAADPGSRAFLESQGFGGFFGVGQLHAERCEGVPNERGVYAMLRESAEGKDKCLVLVNTDVEKEQVLTISGKDCRLPIADCRLDLLGQTLPEMKSLSQGGIQVKMSAGSSQTQHVLFQDS